MCTVTFLPTGDNGYILTSNRDESSARPSAIAPRRHKIHNKYVFFPQDPQAGGTWIATSENNFTLCLLNGAFEAHKRKEAYRLSRGKMLLDFFLYNDVKAFVSQYNFDDIEPFTLLVVDSNQTLSLHECRWDGTTMHVHIKDVAQAHIWSSATLYDKETIALRQVWFNDWLAQNSQEFNVDNIISFHTFGGNADVNNKLVINRDNKMLTLSITAVQKNEHTYKLSYRDILKDETHHYRILQSNKAPTPHEC